MSKCQEIKNMIVEMFKDAKVHSMDEIVSLAIERKIIEDKKDSAVRNAMFQIRRENPSFVNVERGKYKMNPECCVTNQETNKMFEDSLECISKEVSGLRKFDWVNCTDEELVQAREKIAKLKKIFLEVQKLIG